MRWRREKLPKIDNVYGVIEIDGLVMPIISVQLRSGAIRFTGYLPDPPMILVNRSGELTVRGLDGSVVFNRPTFGNELDLVEGRPLYYHQDLTVNQEEEEEV